MRYETFREINPDELPCIAHRRLIAMIDWADHLFDMMDVNNMDDKVHPLIIVHLQNPQFFPDSNRQGQLRTPDDLQFVRQHFPPQNVGYSVLEHIRLHFKICSKRLG